MSKMNDTQASMIKSMKTNRSGGVNSNGNGTDAANQSSDFSSIHTFFEAQKANQSQPKIATST